MPDVLNAETATRTQAAANRIVPQRLHHTARVVKDHEVTRKFYEDVLGLPLVATWTEISPIPESGWQEVHFCHTFYGLADGGALAFFGFAEPEIYEMVKAHKEAGGFNHLAFMVSRADQIDLRARLEAAGYPVLEFDHGYCLSIYVEDPDDLVLEFTSDPPNAAQIAEVQAKSAHETLKRWMGGDLASNNNLYPNPS
jgi:catechol 2,3-dioxygenase-like lactoylglutathione lyase family enzyme